MKNFIKMILIALVSVAGITGYANAYTVGTASVPVTLGVTGQFNLTLATWKGGTGTDRYDLVPINSINFGSLFFGNFTGGKPDVLVDGNQGGLIVRGITNYGNPWTIRIRVNQPLTRQGGSETIPNTNFVFWGWKVAGEANGTVNFTTAQPISTADQILYNSTVAEGDTADTRIHMQFGVNVPAVRVGTYTNTITITMTE